MKTVSRILLLALLISAPILSSTAFSQEITGNPVGKWSSSVPYAPDGFQTSQLTIAKVDDKYTVEMSFAEVGFTIAGEKVTFIDKVFKFGFWIEGEDVSITLKFKEEDKLEGVVVTSGGEMPIIAARIKDK
jgi:hypothetical protein